MTLPSILTLNPSLLCPSSLSHPSLSLLSHFPPLCPSLSSSSPIWPSSLLFFLLLTHLPFASLPSPLISSFLYSVIPSISSFTLCSSLLPIFLFSLLSYFHSSFSFLHYVLPSVSPFTLCSSSWPIFLLLLSYLHSFIMLLLPSTFLPPHLRCQDSPEVLINVKHIRSGNIPNWLFICT